MLRRFYSNRHAAYVGKTSLSQLAPLLHAMTELVRILESMPASEESVVKVEATNAVFESLRRFYVDAIWHTDAQRSEEEKSADLNPLFISNKEESETHRLLEKSSSVTTKLMMTGSEPISGGCEPINGEWHLLY